MTKKRVDAILVTNSDVTLKAITALVESRAIRSAVIVTSHLYYPNEQEILSALFTKGVEFLPFAAVLSEGDLDRADELARTELEGTSRTTFVASYQNRINILKNQWARERVTQIYDAPQTYSAAGLGVMADVWTEEGVAAFQTERPGRTHFWARLRNRFGLERQYATYRDGQQSYLLVGSAKRIPFAKMPSKRLSLPKLLGKLYILWRVLTGGKALHISCSVHDRHGDARHIFIDGYHPSNYPFSYLGSFHPETTFLVSTPFSGQWFRRFGFAIHVPGELLKPSYFAEKIAERPANTRKRILLLLNHAGDWAAIINRSDTESLVVAICSIAKSLPSADFVIRPHPTAVHPEHEGRYAIARLHDYVAWLGLKNLSVSEATLDNDIAMADICVSEYSMTLVTCYERGKPALVANLTRRRSLMQDYQQFGFAYADSLRSLHETLTDYLADPRKFSAQQAFACRAYNIEIKQGLSAATGDGELS